MKMMLDGEEYILSDDKKIFKGKDKTYKVDEFRKEGSKNYPFSIIPPKEVSEGIVYSFSNEQKYEQWLKEKNLSYISEKIKKIQKKMQKERSPEDLEKIKKQQIKEVKKASAKFHQFLKKHNLKENEIEKIHELLEEEYDPELGEPGNSLYLFDKTWYGWTDPSKTLVLPGLLTGRIYRDLEDYDFNNMASSLSTWGSWFVIVFDGDELKGRQFTFLWAHPELHPIGWDNCISSCIVF